VAATPDIPIHLLGQPCAGGLVVPWITPATITGQYLFGNLTDAAQRRCLTRSLCQICGHPLGRRAVMFARESDLVYACTAEPALCPPCAAYSATACPMLSGHRSRYRGGQHPALAGVSASAGQLLRQSAPAEPWYAVWIRGYDVVDHPRQPGTLAGSWRRIPPLRIRPLHPPAHHPIKETS
jgi:hypothetical protein